MKLPFPKPKKKNATVFRNVGVCQAINKKTGYFTKNDEGFLSVLANLAGVVLKNSMSFDQEKVFHHTIRTVLNVNLCALSSG